MRKAIVPLLAAGLGWPLLVNAAEPDYTYLQGEFIINGEFTVDVGDVQFEQDYDGWGLSGSLGLTPMFFIAGEYSDLEVEGGFGGLELISVGPGLRQPLAVGDQPMDVYGIISYESTGGDAAGDDDSDGFGVTAGLRWLPAPQVEISPYIGYVDLDDADGIRAGVDGLFNVTDFVSLLAGYRFTSLEADDVDFGLENEISLGVRVYFGI